MSRHRMRRLGAVSFVAVALVIVASLVAVVGGCASASEPDFDFEEVSGVGFTARDIEESDFEIRASVTLPACSGTGEERFSGPCMPNDDCERWNVTLQAEGVYVEPSIQGADSDFDVFVDSVPAAAECAG